VTVGLDYDFPAEASELRDQLRTLIAEHFPDTYLSPFSDDPQDLELARQFVRTLAAEGLLTIAWPPEYGGRGADVWMQTVVREEMWAHYEPRANHYMGLNWVGPALMRFGTPPQQQFFLPRIAAGEISFCQGFSEPDAGSDLASLRTAATRDGEGWRINGQKIWTSYAEMADWIIVATRTRSDGPRHAGITLFVLPMSDPGIEVRPIRSMIGPHHLNEVFLDDVHATADDVLGGVDEGWAVIRHILAFERVGIARYARSDRLLVRQQTIDSDEIDGTPPALAARYVRAAVHNRIARLLAYRAIDSQSKGSVEDAAAASARISVTLAEQETADVLLELNGSAALSSKSLGGAPLGGAVEDFWRYTSASTVASGSIEILRMLIARAVLGSEDESRSS